MAHTPLAIREQVSWIPRGPTHLSLCREQRTARAARVPHVANGPRRARGVVHDRALLRADEALVLGRAVRDEVEVELEVLHPDALEHRLVVVARRRRRRVVARLLEDPVLRLEPDRGVERLLRLRDERGVARRLGERGEPGRDDTLVVDPRLLAVVRARVGEAARETTSARTAVEGAGRRAHPSFHRLSPLRMPEFFTAGDIPGQSLRILACLSGAYASSRSVRMCVSGCYYRLARAGGHTFCAFARYDWSRKRRKPAAERCKKSSLVTAFLYVCAVDHHTARGHSLSTRPIRILHGRETHLLHRTCCHPTARR